MELQIVNHKNGVEHIPIVNNKFIEANTTEMDLSVIREDHIIPVFVKDNEQTIDHVSFIETVSNVASYCFVGQKLSTPAIRVSHPIKGRIPEAKGKPAKELAEFEKTIYYERMAFMIVINGFRDMVNGNELTLTVGGVKAYNQDNLYNTSGALQNFKVFIGFKNTVCTNLCISTDGLKNSLKVRSLQELEQQVYQLFSNFNHNKQLEEMASMGDRYLSEQQFAQLIGRARMYHTLPMKKRNRLPELKISDTQISTITKAYYKDSHFKRADNGHISLWKLYNLFTGANKGSYIDTFLDRGSNALDFVKGLQRALNTSTEHWFLS